MHFDLAGVISLDWMVVSLIGMLLAFFLVLLYALMIAEGGEQDPDEPEVMDRGRKR